MSTHSASHAMDAVTLVPELLEEILLNLDLTTLLVSVPRVSKKWNQIVSTSTALQQALYFRPVPSSSSTPRTGNSANLEQEQTQPVPNPLLVDKFGSCFFDFGPTHGFLRRAESFYTLPWTSHHHETKLVADGSHRRPRHKAVPPATEDARGDGEAELHRKRFTRPGASWRRMLVSQPPPPQLGFLWSKAIYYIGGPHSVSTALIPCENGGLRMGELYDLVQHHAGHHEYHSLWFRVTWNQPQAPFMSWMYRHYCGKLLEETNVLVEFQHKDDRGLWDHPRDPPEEDVFDSIFRCDEHCKPEFETQDITAHEPGMQGMDVNAAVWSSKGDGDAPLPEYTNLWGNPIYSQRYV